MITKHFLFVLFSILFFQISSYSQFDLVKDFNGSTNSSFSSSRNDAILYSVGKKMIVQYDSFTVDGEYSSSKSLAAVDATGNIQRLAYSLFNSVDKDPFSDFKTLPNGNVAFIVVESNISFKVLITDGTAAGTVAAYSSPLPIQGLEVIDNNLYVTHLDNLGHSLLKIELATLVASEVASFGTLHKISDITKISTTEMIFLAPDPMDNKLTLYVSDGTAAGTTALEVINSGSAVVEDAILFQVGNKVYFFSKLPDVACCSSLWVTDGTVAGTQKIKEFNILSADLLIGQKMIFSWNNKFYFAGIEAGSNTDHLLWVSDGTTAGTIQLMPSSVENIHPRYFTVFKDALYFVTADGFNYDNKLYKTDGTVSGTAHISLSYHANILIPSALAADNDYLYVGAEALGDFVGDELFRYDGIHTECPVLEGESGVTGNSNPTSLYIHEGVLYFTAYLPSTGKELYTTGGDFTSVIATTTKSSTSVSCSVYPNPATNTITIQSSEQVKSLRLINQFGNFISETNDLTLKLETVSEGIYFVEIEFMNGESSFQKIVITK